MIGLKIDRAIVRLSKKLKDVILTKPNHVLPLFGAYTPFMEFFRDSLWECTDRYFST